VRCALTRLRFGTLVAGTWAAGEGELCAVRADEGGSWSFPPADLDTSLEKVAVIFKDGSN